ncbi:MAG: beta-lactamase family protein [Bryobacteraceae bacterium]|nr:beta-lactamase family protein [Bryobacteraceae bacterium]
MTAILPALLLLAQATAPDTPAGKGLSAWLAAMNGGDLAAFHRDHMAGGAANAEDRIKRGEQIRRQSGGFTLVKIVSSQPTRIDAALTDKNSNFPVRIELSVEPEPPHRIVSIGVRHADDEPPSPVSGPPARMTQEAAIAAARAEIEKRAAEDRFAGAVMVTRKGEPVFTGAWGLADRAAKIANTTGTKFNLGSMNKMFTAVAVAQLAQAGKLKFSDPVGKFLPDYPNQEVATKVTLHHLLTHTGGVGDIFTPEFLENKEKFRELSDYVKAFGNRPPEFEPGARFQYANYGMVLAGRIVEVVSGMNYYDYVREKIFKRAGMSSSDSFWKTQKVADLAPGYTRDRKPNFDSLPMRGSAAGGGYSTVEDLTRFASALMNHKLLDKAHTDLVLTGKVTARGADKYAYGFIEGNQGGVRTVGHGGGAPGINGNLIIMPESGYVIAVLGNLEPPAAEQVSRFIADRLPAK